MRWTAGEMEGIVRRGSRWRSKRSEREEEMELEDRGLGRVVAAYDSVCSLRSPGELYPLQRIVSSSLALNIDSARRDRRGASATVRAYDFANHCRETTVAGMGLSLSLSLAYIDRGYVKFFRRNLLRDRRTYEDVLS